LRSNQSKEQRQSRLRTVCSYEPFRSADVLTQPRSGLTPEALADFLPPSLGDVGILIPILHAFIEAFSSCAALALNPIWFLAD